MAGMTHSDIEAVYRAEFANLVRFATVMGAGPNARDIVHDAFGRLMNSWDRIEDHSKVPAWLRTTVLNLIRSGGRRNREVVALFAEQSDSRPGPETAAEGSDTQARLRAGVERLAQRQREVITCRFFLQLSEQETAETLGISTGSVRTHQQRALEALRKQVL
jgi:RNA polymerase sigma factor (sigma-70 family)